MINLPITEKELDVIIEDMKLHGNRELYQKLWSYKMNYLHKEKQQKNYGLS